MKELIIKNGVVIPVDELEISFSRAGGPGGQHVNKASTRVTVRWNIKSTQVLTDEQKERLLERLKNIITEEGDLIVHNATSRSQLQNKENALKYFADKVRRGLYIPKKRMKMRVNRAQKEARLETKARRSQIKKMRSKVFE
ncbi:TPA: aminoacyl-tRNA hydrolase [Candidatus Dependentiae bacterium]|nr:MAG: hypothetical protein US03_C0001G0003 [candidate division TM6 bacterium GW2011_GWF2_36_131]KKQ03861.1 MAG: hypothetical protein US13_C0001G0201 [candidate division TM6 bacterium GW2011_GWE2_36_25]KKQ19430.1 MAG: hypothetical protein US32_C0009G0002 [candidate division TM6 bacterium GW2011_GWA2_36_9]HBR70629.1 aminoacyl-tRNA hydrolase [Candidatus Dependentiae bacterium]HCU00656.1 aminoacyl-tRNA hydrolase [Candidatus Dependentiae bacterium]